MKLSGVYKFIDVYGNFFETEETETKQYSDTVTESEKNITNHEQNEIIDNKSNNDSNQYLCYPANGTAVNCRRLNEKLYDENMKAPYQYLADENNVITYKGVVFVCNSEKQELCLGDMSNPKAVLDIPLSGGGVLRVNRDNIGALAKAIEMFSPEDIGRIMQAIAEDTHFKKKQNEIEEEKTDIIEEKGEIKDNTGKRGSEYFVHAQEEVEIALKAAEEETGMNGLGFDKTGKLTHISQAKIARLFTDAEESIFGNSLASAIHFAENAIQNLSNPKVLEGHSIKVQEEMEKEKQFYEVFLEKLKESNNFADNSCRDNEI